MTHLTQDDIENIYMQGWFHIESNFGPTFNYQAFAAAVLRANEVERQKQIDETCSCAIEGSPCPNCRKKSNY